MVKSIPCAAFRHKVPRIENITDYMVYYSAKGTGPENISPVYVGRNSDAMPAELAYQIGLNLLKTKCCQQSALKYIEHAYQLFSDSPLYRTTYQKFRLQLAKDTQASFNSSGVR